MADVYEQSRRSAVRGVLAEANLAYLADACEYAGVKVGAFDARILTWLANWEPETCAVVTGLITRAYASGASGLDRNGAISSVVANEASGPYITVSSESAGARK